ncbi:MAG: hypothetical protein CMI16_03350 [Opitutaceae bacterium]|nr:hypothetical protein [Opitutaceae bacterium]|tara:strand:- start:42 stop:434 length:393 start_codon:yes stop_codon:yes gene_type:complete
MQSQQLVRRVWVGSTLLLSNYVLDFVNDSNNKLATFLLLLVLTSTISYAETEYLHYKVLASTPLATVEAPKLVMRVGHWVQETLLFLYVQYVLMVLNSLDIKRLPLYNAVVLVCTIGTFGYTVVQKVSQR